MHVVLLVNLALVHQEVIVVDVIKSNPWNLTVIKLDHHFHRHARTAKEWIGMDMLFVMLYGSQKIFQPVNIF